VALALLVALIVLVAGLGWVVRGQLALGAQQIEERRDQVARLTRLTARLETMRGQVASLEAGSWWTPLVLDAPSDRLATADLQQRLKSILTRSGGTLTSARVLEPEDAGRFRQVGLDARVGASVQGLRDTLYELESGSPLLVVDDVVIVARRKSRRTRRNVRVPPLDVRFRVVGYMLADEPPPGSSQP
jgi:general secretion pathway protein M